MYLRAHLAGAERRLTERGVTTCGFENGYTAGGNFSHDEKLWVCVLWYEIMEKRQRLMHEEWN